MFFRIIPKREIPELVRGLAREHEVIGPVAKDGSFVYAPVEDPSKLWLDYGVTLLPAKAWFFPPSETIMTFRVADNVVVDTAVEETKRVLFGLHPCDVNSLLLMDNVFLGANPDPYYKARRDNTLIVGVTATSSPRRRRTLPTSRRTCVISRRPSPTGASPSSRC